MFCRLTAAIILGIAATVAADVPDLKPGVESSVPWDGLKNPVLVRPPDDYTPDLAWPVIFHYHGMGGTPTIDIPQSYTEGKHFILVGMDYATGDSSQPTAADYLDREWSVLLAVRGALAKKVRLDPARTYVGGFSLGGWTALEFAEVHGRDLAGAYILGAGKRPIRYRDPKPFGSPRPVFIGIGQVDPNYLFAVAAIRHFGGLGGTVTFDEFLGIGHTMPDSAGLPPSSYLRQWFAVEAAKADPAPLRATAAAWKDAQLALVESEKIPARRLLRLIRLTRAPYFSWLPPEARKAVGDRLAALEKSPDLADEIAARSAYLAVVDAQLKDFGWEQSASAAFRFHEIWAAHPDSYNGRRAALELSRLHDQLTHLETWHFPNDQARQKIEDKLKQKPIPDAPKQELTKGFRDIQAALDKP